VAFGVGGGSLRSFSPLTFRSRPAAKVDEGKSG
jgi:hypothetical protein